MSFAFISYKREDEIHVARLAQALEAAGTPVWWDRGLPNGESWHTAIEERLDASGCVIVVWSHASVAPEGRYVRDEARRGLDRNSLVPVIIDPIKALPLGFGEIQAIDLSRWRGDPKDPFFQDLVAAIQAKFSGAAAPKPRGPVGRLRRRLLLGGASSAGLALTAALAMNAFGAAGRICKIPGPQPALSDLCGALRLGGRPSQAERLAWERRPLGQCEALRTHINRFPEGAYRGEAEALLAARRVQRQDNWRPATRDLPLFEAAEDESRVGSRDQAQTRAISHAAEDAARLCKSFASGALFRFVSATPVAEVWSCASQGAGVTCGFDGHAACALEERRIVEQEQCGPTPPKSGLLTSR
jgi:hypothetical protein